VIKYEVLWGYGASIVLYIYFGVTDVILLIIAQEKKSRFRLQVFPLHHYS
jgi:hypothetical protein